MKKLMGFIVCAVILCAVGASGQVTWDNDSGDGLWNTATNWSGNAVPGTGNDVQISGIYNIDLGTGDGKGREIRVGHLENSDITITNGSLTVGASEFVVAVSSNSTAKVYLTDLVKTSNQQNDSIAIATKLNAAGELHIETGGNSIIKGRALNVGTARNAGGILTATTRDIRIARTSSIGTGSNSTASVTVSNFNGSTAGRNYADDFKVAAAKDTLVTFTANTAKIYADDVFVANSARAHGTLNIGTGMLSADRTIGIGSGAGSTGIVTLGTFNHVTGSQSASDVNIGHAADAYGSLTASGGTLIADNLQIADFENAVGILDMGDGTIWFDNNSDIALGNNSSGVVSALTATVAPQDDTKKFIIAGGENSYGSLTVSNFIAAHDIRVATGRNSSGSLAVTEPIAMDATNGIFIGTGEGSSASIGSTTFSFTGPIGNFGVGDGTDAATIDLFSQNDTYGIIEANKAFSMTNGHHEIRGIIQNAAVSVTGAATTDFIGGGEIGVATITDAIASMDLGADWGVSGVVTAADVAVASGGGSTGAFIYTNGHLHVAGAFEVVEATTGAKGTVVLGSLSTGGNLRTGNDADGPGNHTTGTVAIAGDADIGASLNMSRAADTFGKVTVGGTLSVGNYFQIAHTGSNAVASVTAATLNKTSALRRMDIGTSVNSDGSVIASGGTMVAAGLMVGSDADSVGAKAANATGIFAVTNGTLTTSGPVRIADGTGASGTVLLDTLNKTSSGASIVIATGSNSMGSLTVQTANIEGAKLKIATGGGTAAGTFSVGSGVINVNGLEIGTGGTLDLTDPVVTIGGDVFADVTTLVGSGNITGSGTTTDVITNGWTSVTNSGSLYWGVNADNDTVVWAGIAVSASPYKSWAIDYGLTYSPENDPGYDYDGDALSNLAEYGLNGNPTNVADVGNVPNTGRFELNGTNYFVYIYIARTDDSSLTNYVEIAGNLGADGWTNDTSLYEQVGPISLVDPIYEGFGEYTIMIPTAGKTNEFIRLRFELTE